ncbi:sodium:solute symporter family transporter [Botrimarina mediterranea]|uniref:Sodium/glucose cotransporter n=1 Tax=Botrimarina mediterranea TaxID=2528022 RepID=A0A518K6X1_9BACT|nr:sodium/solute symporter [Botrimarina mediterranea]QDV73534.1 Sodium/glucose cotransporter [Botrimarina mediterranea]QDV78125.1 Sodium/glucose cotransporter [Planctomycetes bacterium K2D]
MIPPLLPPIPLIPVLGVVLAPLDLVILGSYLLVTVVWGSWPKKGTQSAERYLLGGRDLAWPLLLLSIVATETSTVTFLSLPGQSFVEGGDLTFLQITAGYVVGRFVVIALLLPEFFRGQAFTAYEVLEDRFGPGIRQAASVLFLVCRTLADGLRLFLTGLALQQALGWDLPTCVAAITVMTAIYATLGGVSSVVWNDAVQLTIYLVGAALAAWLIVQAVPGGATAIVDFGVETGRLHLLDWDFGFFGGKMTFWSGLIGGAFLSLATHGVDHLMVQRYLCARSQRSAAIALGLSGPVVALQFLLFLLIGVGLAAFYATNPGGEGLAGDQAFAAFITNHVPTGVRGFLFAAVIAAAMSTLSSSLNSSAGVAVRDVFKPLLGVEGANSVRVAQLATIVFALLQCAVALTAHWTVLGSSVINDVLAIAGFTTGVLVGLFALGMICGRCRPLAAAIALIAGVVAGAALFGWNWSNMGSPNHQIHWTWNALIASSSTLGAGYAAAKVLEPQP